MEKLLLGPKRSKRGKLLEKKFALSYFRQDPSPTSLSVQFSGFDIIAPIKVEPLIIGSIETEKKYQRSSTGFACLRKCFLIVSTKGRIVGGSIKIVCTNTNQLTQLFSIHMPPLT
jgi:hypothetical protein